MSRVTLPLATVLVPGSPTALRMPGWAVPARLIVSRSTWLRGREVDLAGPPAGRLLRRTTP